MTALHRLQNWYKSQCNGDWEHTFQVKIETVDNPGWSITIDLEDTSLESVEFKLTQNNGEFDWFTIIAADKKYSAAGDPDKLEFLIEYFLDQVLPKYSDNDVHYEIFIPLEGGPTKIWTPCKARTVDEDTFEITDIPAPEYGLIKTQSLEELTFGADDVKLYKTTCKVGERIQTTLIETFDGIKLAKK